MSTITDSNIFTVEDYPALASLPVGTVVTELHGFGSEQWTAEVREGGKVRQVYTDPAFIADFGPYGPDRLPNCLVLPVRVVNPELVATEAEILGLFEIGQRVRLVSTPYRSSFLQEGATGTVVKHSNSWTYRVQIDGNANGDWGFDSEHLEPLVEVEAEEDPLTEWERELLGEFMGDAEEADAAEQEKCCGKYEPCPKAEPLGLVITVTEYRFAPVGN